MGQQDRDQPHGEPRHGDDVGGRVLARVDHLAEHPNRERGLLAGGEGGDDDLVEGEGEG